MFLNKDEYIAIIGDIVNSRKSDDRYSTQKKLFDVLNEINTKYKDSLASRFMITLGDEFQGLLKSGENIVEILEEIEYKLYPVKIRFGIGIGEIKTEIFYNPIGSDGPAYYKARDAIEYLKHSTLSDIYVITDNKNRDALLNTVFSLLYTLKDKWTSKQRNVVHKAYKGKNQREIAEELGTTRSAVQQVLKRADYNSYKAALYNVARVFSDTDEDK